MYIGRVIESVEYVCDVINSKVTIRVVIYTNKTKHRIK